MKRDIIGIIGGMGPMATLNLFQKILVKTPAKCDQEHAHVIIDNNTKIPDRTAYLLHGMENPEFEIFNSACRLIDAGANILIMPCNTAHYFYNAVKAKIDQKYKNIDYKFINMIDETAKFIQSQGCKKIFLLATEGTYKSKIYHYTCIQYGIDILIPDKNSIDIIMKAIYNYKGGIPNYYKDEMIKIIEDAAFQGVSKIVLGCTELSIIFRELNLLDNSIDPTEILAKSALKQIKADNQ
ncbi:MAG: amino acid racemase [Clostridia bacterium]|nr:amino acid racemase [Clostridia bacterium]